MSSSDLILQRIEYPDDVTDYLITYTFHDISRYIYLIFGNRQEEKLFCL